MTSYCATQTRTISLRRWRHWYVAHVFVDTVLVDPVGLCDRWCLSKKELHKEGSAHVQDAETTTSTSNTFFSGRAKGALEFQLVDTLVDGFTVGCSLWCRALPVTAANTDTVDHVALLGLSKT